MKKGFTLVEMIVALAIFSVVAVIALGALVKIIATNKKAQTLQMAMNSVNYALETISRELRVSKVISCYSPPKNSGNGADNNGYDGANMTSSNCNINHSAVITNGALESVIYFQSNRISTDPGNPCNLADIYRFIRDNNGRIRFQRTEQPDQTCNSDYADSDLFDTSNEANYTYDIIDPLNITLTDYRIGVGPNGSNYPMVYIRLVGYVGSKEKDKTPFDVQTTLSQRVL